MDWNLQYIKQQAPPEYTSTRYFNQTFWIIFFYKWLNYHFLVWHLPLKQLALYIFWCYQKITRWRWKPHCCFIQKEDILPGVSEVKDLSYAQRFLYDTLTNVINGEHPPNLGNRSPGNISHVRYVTMASKIETLFLY